jgi:tRNA1(Val) A37 N6-methylase TrmN6
MKGNIIINDDFRNHLSVFSGEKYIISDPPYNQDYHYGEYDDKLSIDEYGEMMK